MGGIYLILASYLQPLTEIYKILELLLWVFMLGNQHFVLVCASLMRKSIAFRI